jgi:transposase-like protein
LAYRGLCRDANGTRGRIAVSYLPKHLQEAFRKKLQAAYSKEDHKKAKAALQAIKRELRLINESAVNSLEEGFEETLTIQRLGMHSELMRSFKTTNMIESIMALVGQRTDKVDYWKNSNQKQRWVAGALMSIEPRLRRIHGYRYLSSLRNAMKREIDKVILEKVV